jgi:DNA polymerase
VGEDRAFLTEQARERLRFYRSLTSVGLARRSQGLSPELAEARPTAARESLAAIRQDLGECTRCRLSQGRRTIVFGAGNPRAALMFVGEGPGFEEDLQGLPFVGPAGELLTRIIQAIELSRDEVYIANIVKCRPPNNREPEPDEIATCRPFLERQIRAIRPRVICSLGRVATQALLATSRGINELRGKIYSWEDVRIVPTYHPAYLLRNPGDKRKTWEDVKLVRSLLDEPGPDDR